MEWVCGMACGMHGLRNDMMTRNVILCRMTERNKLNRKFRPFLAPVKQLKDQFLSCRKIPKISPGAYIFQRPFLSGLFLERHLRFKIDWASLQWEENLPFCFVLLWIRGQIPSTSSLGGLHSEGRFNGGIFALRFWGAYIWRALYIEELIFGNVRYYKKDVQPSCTV